MKRETNNFLVGMIAGAVVGAASALLFSPMRGEEARGHIRHHAERARNRATETGQRLQSQISSVRQRASEAGSRVRETVAGARARQMIREKLNLNTASKDDLLNTEGINSSLADDIISYREQHGGFRNLDELDDVYSLGDSLMNRLRERFTT